MTIQKILVGLVAFSMLLTSHQLVVKNDFTHIRIKDLDFCYIPPSPYTSLYIQPDGTTIEFYVKGNQYDHRVETLDGKTIAFDTADSYFKYAERGPDGMLRPGLRIAHAINERDQAEIDFVNQLPERLDHSPKAKQDLKIRFLERRSHGSNDNQNMGGPQKAPGDGNGPSYGGVPGGSTPTTGAIKVLALFIEFPDQEHDHEMTAFNNFFNQQGYSINGSSGSFRDYYLQASNGQLDVHTDVFGWYMAENPKSFYADDAPYLIREAVDAAEAAGVDFSQYDNNNDGLVDGLLVFHSLRGQEESGNPNDIWSHRWQMAAYNLGVVYDGVSINHYTVQAEEYGYSIANIGVTAHEFGHALGLPDLYDADYDGSGGNSSGTGKWDLMAGGGWNNSGKTPAHPMAWCKQYLGWVNPEILSGSGTISNMQAVSSGGSIYRINTPVPTEYFLLENRQLSGFDSQIPGQGLMIWHIDETRTDNWPSANNINVVPTDLGIAGEIASGGSAINSSDTPFGSSNFSFDQLSNPNSNNKNGSPSTVSLTNILSVGGQISLSYNQSAFCNGQVDNINLAEISESSVEVSWNNKDAPAWQVNYGIAGFAPGSGANTLNGFVTSAKSSLTLSGLTPDTNYDLYIRGDCSATGNGFSVWIGPVSFRTYCNAALTLPVAESFESGALPSCWVQSLEDDLNWTFQTGNTPSPLSGPAAASNGTVYAYLETSLSFASGNYASLITPTIDLSTSVSPRITFQYHMYGEETGTLFLDVLSGSTGGEWQNIWYKTGQQQSSSTDPWALATVDLSEYIGEMPRFRFSANIAQFHSGSGPGGDIAIDNIRFEESPVCLEPQSINFSNFTPTSVSINWTQADGVAEIEYGTNGFVQGTGTLITGATLPYTLGGLTPNTTYEVYIRNNCSPDGMSAWFGPYEWTTLCNIVPIPYEENFESGNFSACWIQPLNDDGNWLVRTGAPPTANTGPIGAYQGNHYAYIETNNFTSFHSAEVISPTIDLTAANDPILEFYYHMYGAEIGTLRVHAENPAGSGNWELLGSITGQQQLSRTTAFEEMVLDLAQYNDQSIRLRFTASFGYLSGYTGDLAIDYLRVYERPACENPDNISASNIRVNEVTLQWETGGSNTWDIQYGSPGFNPLLETANMVHNTSSNPYVLTGLTPETSYHVYIRDNCGIDGVSTWEGPFQFATLCLKQTPYFENISANSIPGCWESDPWEIFSNGALVASWQWTGASSSVGDLTTGPSVPHDGNFLYTSAAVHPSNSRIEIGLISSPVDFGPISSPEMSFYHHQFANNNDPNYISNGALIVYVESPIGSDEWSVVKQFNGNYQTQKADPFILQRVDLSEFSGQVVRVKLVASYYPYQKGIIAVDDFSFGEREECSVPTNISVLNLTDHTATIRWAQENGTGWNMQYGAPGFNPSNSEGTLITNISTLEYELTGLSANTNYELYVQNDCSSIGNGTSYWSKKLEFTTLNLQALPFSEGFDGGSGVPPNWESITPTPWRRESGLPLNYTTGHSSESGPSQPYSGTHYLSFNPFAAPINQDQLLTYSKPIDLRNTVSPSLTLWYHFFGIYKYTPSGLETSMNVQVESEWASDQWQTIHTISGQHQFEHADPWKELWLDLSSFAGKIIRLRFVANIGPSTSNAGTMAIDYLSISDNQCPTVTSIKQVTKGLNSATIEWSGKNATAWDLVIGAPGFDPNGGSIITGIANPVYEITGLTPGTVYEVYIRSDCGGGLWSAPFEISSTNTLTLPYIENFESGLQSSWFAPEGENSHWRVSSGSTTTTDTGANAGGNGGTPGFVHHEGGWPESNGLAYLISPVFDFTAANTPILNFAHHFYGLNTNNVFDVSGGLEIESPAFSNTWQTLWSIDKITHSAAQPYTNHQIDLSNYNNQLVRFRLFGTGTGIWSDLSVDDFTIAEAAICVVPTDINVSPTSSSVIITYSKNGAPSTDVVYGTPGFNPDVAGTLLTGVTDNSFTVTGLTPSSNYQFYLRNNCTAAGNGSSAWQGPFAFTTLHTISFPNVENFDHGGAAPTGWTLTAPTRESWLIRTGGTPTTLTGPSGARSGAYYIYLEANNSTTGEEAWLLSPEIDLTGVSQPYLTFYSHMYGSTTGSLHAEIENPVGSGNWVSLLSLHGQRQSAETSPYEYQIFSLAEFTNPVRVRIRAVDASGIYSDIAIDDISFESIDCAIPKNATLRNSNVGEATIAWNGNNESAWLVEYGETGFTPGTGIMLAATSESIGISGLNQGTNYDVYISADCSIQGDGNSQIIGPLALEMLPVAPFPYSESFEDNTIQPWRQAVDDNFDWLIATGAQSPTTTGPASAADGSRYLYIKANTSSEGQNASIISPILDLTNSTDGEVLEYYTHAYGSNIGKLELKIETPALSGNWITIDEGGFVGQQQATETSPYQLHSIDLSSYSGTYIRIAFIATDGPSVNGDIALDKISVYSCSLLPVVSLSNITHNSVNASWVDESSVLFDLEYVPSGSPLTGNNLVTGITNANYLITGLSPSTTYDVYVRSYCDIFDKGRWVGPLSFETACVITIPYTQDFENAGQLPACWQHAAAAPWRWPVSSSPNTGLATGPSKAHSGTYYLRSLSPTITGNFNKEYYLLSPVIDLQTATNPYLSFFFHMFGISETHGIAIDINFPVGSDNWDRVDEIYGSHQVKPTDNYQERFVDLSNYSGQVIRVRLTGFTGSQFPDYVGVDLIRIGERATCHTAYSLEARDIQPTSFTLDWQMGTMTSWNVEYGPVGFTPGTGTGTQITTSSGEPLIVDNLNPGETYQVYIQSDCSAQGNGFSSWSQPLSVYTPCVFPVDYIEGFESALMPDCWEQDIHDGGLDWEIETGKAYDGSRSLFFDITTSTYGEPSYILSPWIDLSSGQSPFLSFYYRRNRQNTAKPTDFFVDIIDRQGNRNIVYADSSRINTNGESDFAPNKFKSVFYDLNEFIGDSIRIAFGGRSWTTLNHDISVDNFNVSDIPCLYPVNLNASQITGSSALLSWQGGNNAHWDIRYGVSGFESSAELGGGNILEGIADPELRLTGLSPDVSYNFYVRSDCSASGYGTTEWSGPYTFKTKASVSLPFVEDFENLGLPDGWTNEGASTFWTAVALSQILSYSHITYTGTPTNTQSGSRYCFYDGSSGQPGDKASLYTPEIDLTGTTNPTLLFYYHIYSPNMGAFEVAVQNSSNPGVWNSHTIYKQHQSFVTDPFKPLQMDLTAYANSKIIIRFTGENGTDDKNPITIDSVAVFEEYCPAPSSILANNIGLTSAEIAWYSNFETSWDMEYGVHGFTRGTGNYLSGIAQNPVSLEDLIPGTQYDVYLRSTCNAASGNWSDALTFRTRSIQVLPYNEGFESTDYIVPHNWIQSDNDRAEWLVLSGAGNSFIASPSGAYYQKKYISFDNHSDLEQPEDEGSITSPHIDLSTATDPQLVFYYWRFNYPTNKFWISIEQNGVWTNDLWIANEGAMNGIGNAPYLKQTIDLSPYVGDTIRVRFSAKVGANYLYGQAALDEVSFAEAPCGRPHDLALDFANSNSAQISWEASGQSSGNWEMIYGEVGIDPNDAQSNTIVAVNSNPFTIENLQPSTEYEVYIRELCSESTSSFWSRPFNFTTPGPSGVDLGDDIISCTGETIVVNAGPGFESYLWSTGETSQSISVNTSGEYSVTAIDDEGIEYTDAVTVTFNLLPTVSLGTDINVCFGGTSQLDAGTGFASYSWSTGETTQTITANTSGNYSVEVTDNNGCSGTDEITVTVRPAVAVNLGADISVCSGETAQLDAGAGFASYSWSTGQTTQTITASTSGNYAVNVTDNNGCSGTDEITVTVRPALSVSLGSDITVCSGETAQLDAGAGFASYSWSTGATTQTITANTSGNYAVNVTDNNGCSGTDEIIVTVRPAVSVNLGSDVTVCSGETAQLDAGAGFASYSWSTGATTQTITANTSGNYSVNVTDNNGCSGTDEIIVTVRPAVSANLGSDVTVCSGETAQLDAGAGFASYSWSTGATTQTITANTSGNYSVNVTDNNGCSGTDEITVTVRPALSVSLGSDITVCSGETAQLDAGAGFASYLWSTGETTQVINIDTLGEYHVIVSDGSGCLAEDVITVNTFLTQSINLGGNLGICEGESIKLDAGPGFVSYLWNTGNTSQSINVENGGQYTITAIDLNGCTAFDMVRVDYNQVEISISEIFETSVIVILGENSKQPLKLEYGLSGFASGQGVVLNRFDSNVILIEDLSPATNYDLWITFDCINDFSNKLAFTTKDNLWLTDQIVLFPNPSPGIVTIKINPGLNTNLFSLEIVDAVGIVKQFYTSVKDELSIDNLDSGVYFAKISMADKIYIRKFVIN